MILRTKRLLLGIVSTLICVLTLAPFLSFAQTASSTDTTGSSSAQMMETTSASTSMSMENTSSTSASSTNQSSSSSQTGMLDLVDSRVSSSPISQGQTATIDAVIKSQNASTSNTRVEMTFLDENNDAQGTTTVFQGVDFPKDQQVTLTATSSPDLMPGTYHVSVSVFSNDRSQKYVTFENVQSFTVNGIGSNGGGTGTSSSTTTGSSASTTPSISSVDSSNIRDIDGTISFNLSGLTPATDYTFIGSLWRNGNLITSRQQDFRTNEASSSSTSTNNGSTTSSSGGNSTGGDSSSNSGSGQNITVSNISASPTEDGTGVTITWATDQNANSQVEFGATTSYTSSSTLTSSQSTNHSVTLSGLTPGTLYHFRVISTDSNGTMIPSSDYTFTTAAGNGTIASSTTDVSTLQSRIVLLQEIVIRLLEQRLQSLNAGANGNI